MSCIRSSGGVSSSSRAPWSVSTTAPTLLRLSRGSGEWQTAHPHPICGTPKLVPVPRKVSFIATVASDCLDLQQVRRAGHVERNSGSDNYSIPGRRELALDHGYFRAFHHLVVAVAMRH